jgi:hypothetical protein
MNDITLQIINNNLPISNCHQSIDLTGETIYTWYNTDTKKWYIGDDWSQKCNFGASSAMNCGGKYYINKLYKNVTKETKR